MMDETFIAHGVLTSMARRHLFVYGQYGARDPGNAKYIFIVLMTRCFSCTMTIYLPLSQEKIRTRLEGQST